MTRVRMVVCGAMLMAAALGAQERRQGGPPAYNPENEITVTASVMSLETVTPPDGAPAQAVLMVEAEGGALGVFMGPSAWFTKQGVTFKKGDTVQVTGLRGARYNGNPALMPRVVKVGNKTVTVRDAKGIPMWEAREQSTAR